MILKGKQIKLVPVKSNKYAIDLVSRYFDVPKPDVENYFKQYAQEFWDVYNKGKLVGIIGFYLVDGEYILESIKDKDAPTLGMVGAVETGMLALNYLNRTATTAVKIEVKPIQKLVGKLGFKEIMRDDKFIVYKKEMRSWVG
jgi:hypothetical protein